MLSILLLLLLLVDPSGTTGAQFYAPELFPPTSSGAVCGFSNDGSTIYFVREDTLADKLFIYEATARDGQWEDVKLLSFSGVYNDMGGRLSQDGQTFYFTSDRPGGSNNPEDKWNIWVSAKTSQGWADATPLERVNTGNAECCPTPFGNEQLLFSASHEGAAAWQIYNVDQPRNTWVHQLSNNDAWQWPSYFDKDEGILFLNSMKRPDSRGKDDIYLSFFRDGQWTENINLGNTVNTEAYEDGALLSPDKKWLIFCRHGADTPSRVVCISWPGVRQALGI